ncbi:MAG: hypothetical protein JRE64_16470 [Deltaproteobacteria bacterium]|nr:hypothetical protein [Deltaproteobacteria bacterium]
MFDNINMDHKLQKWIKWLDVIKVEISELLIGRNIFWQMLELIESNQVSKGKLILGHYLCSSYVSHVVMGIRRQIKIDKHKQNISFARLLAEIIDNPGLISRQYFKELYINGPIVNKADDHFNEYSMDVYDHIDPEMVKSDLKHLKKYSDNIENLSDQRLAHRDKKNFKSVPQISELESCIEAFEILCRKYYLIFHAEHIDLLSDYNEPDLKQIFYDTTLLEKLTEQRHQEQRQKATASYTGHLQKEPGWLKKS